MVLVIFLCSTEKAQKLLKRLNGVLSYGSMVDCVADISPTITLKEIKIDTNETINRVQRCEIM